MIGSSLGSKKNLMNLSKKIDVLVIVFCAVLVFSPFSAKAVNLVPHKITYTVELARAKQSSDVIGASGDSSYTFADGCEGWLVTDETNIYLNYATGTVTELKSKSSSFEDKEGHNYNLHIRRSGNMDEQHGATVKFDAKEKLKKAVFDTTDKVEGPTKFSMPDGTYYPIQFTNKLIEAALKNEHFLNAHMFDGMEIAGDQQVTAIIGKPQATGTQAAIKNIRGWPIHLAFFDDKSQAGESVPDYEVRFMLRENGITDQITVDYGDFALDFKVKKIEIIKSACQ